MSYHHGMGVYPGDPCYDSSRPSWLPYWLDDFTESDCKWGSSNIAGATLNAFENPDVVAQNVGGVIGQGAASATSDVAGGAEQAISSYVQNLTPGGWFGLFAVGLGALLVLGVVLRK